MTVTLSAPISVTNNMLLPGSALINIRISCRLESGNNKSGLTSVDLLNVTNLNALGPVYRLYRLAMVDQSDRCSSAAAHR